MAASRDTAYSIERNQLLFRYEMGVFLLHFLCVGLDLGVRDRKINVYSVFLQIHLIFGKRLL